MYIAEIMKFAERLDGFSKVTPKSESWSRYVKETINEMREALDHLEKEVSQRDDERMIKAGVKDNWGHADTVFNEWR